MDFVKFQIESKRKPAARIGKILLGADKITPQDAEQILILQKEKGLSFGEAALELQMITREDLDKALAEQFSFPYLREGEEGFAKELITAYGPFSSQAESLRDLRNQLMLRWFSKGKSSLALVSPDRGEGRSYTAANLAVVFAQMGERTLLIDADMRFPHQHEIFNLRNDVGLSTLLSGRSERGGVPCFGVFSTLSVLPAGPVPPNPQELLHRESFVKLFDVCSENFDIILIDTPASNLSADAEIVAVKVGGAMMVTREGCTLLDNAKDLMKRLTDSGVEMVGAVLNKY